MKKILFGIFGIFFAAFIFYSVNNHDVQLQKYQEVFPKNDFIVGVLYQPSLKRVDSYQKQMGMNKYLTVQYTNPLGVEDIPSCLDNSYFEVNAEDLAPFSKLIRTEYSNNKEKLYQAYEDKNLQIYFSFPEGMTSDGQYASNVYGEYKNEEVTIYFTYSVFKKDFNPIENKDAVIDELKQYFQFLFK